MKSSNDKDRSGKWVGESDVMRALWDKVTKLVQRKTKRMPYVLLRGETGTGKGLLAKLLHEMSPRAAGRLVELNCASIPESLLEGELFGYAAGAFTDAKRTKPGLLETADGGTLFLDEVGLLPLGMQAKLLKALEERSMRRLGETECRTIDLWIVSATNVDLLHAVKKGLFRRDLYHRLAVVTLEIPPVRERGRDVTLLAEHCLREASGKYELGERRFSPEAAASIARYRWPGNVREMANAIEQAVVLSESPTLSAESLGVGGQWEDRPRSEPGESAGLMKGGEREGLLEALEGVGWNISRAAQRYGISRDSMRWRMKKYGLKRPEGRQSQHAVRLSQTERRAREEHGEVGEQDQESFGRWPQTLPSRHEVMVAVRVAVTTADDYKASVSTMADLVAEKIRDFGGEVERGLGVVNGVFGRDSQEDTTRRAVCAALEATALSRNEHHGMTVRAAVFVPHPPVSPAERLQEHGRISDVLESLTGRCADARVVVSEPVQQVVARWCRLERVELGEETWYCVEGPMGERGAGLRGIDGLGKFIGREEELEMLRARWLRAAEGEGQFVGIVGEAGIGKSRLIQEFCGSLGDEATHVRVSCEPHGREKACGVVAELLWSLSALRPFVSGILKGDAAAEVGPSVENRLEGGNNEEKAEYVARVLRVASAALRVEVGSCEASGVDSGRVHRLISEAIDDLLRQHSAEKPVVCVLEDIHWMDDASEQCVRIVIEAAASLPVLFLATYRPEYVVGWRGGHVSQVGIGKLSTTESQCLAEWWLSDRRGEHGVVARVLERAGGNPLYVEEICAGLIAGAPDEAVSPTVRELVLEPATALNIRAWGVLQVIAVVGIRALGWLVEAVCRRMGIAEVKGMELARSAWVREAGDAKTREYVFQHGIVRDVVYDSIEPEEKKRCHEAVAVELERAHQGRLDEVCGVIADHYRKAELWNKAVEYLVAEGGRAARSGCHEEALKMWESALACVEQAGYRITGLLRVGIAMDEVRSLVALGRLVDAEARLSAVEEIVGKIGDRSVAVRHQYLVARVRGWLGGDRVSAADVERIAQDAVACADPATVVRAYCLLAEKMVLDGRLREGVEWGRRAVVLCEQIGQRRWMGRAWWMTALAQAEMGCWEDALVAANNAVMLGEVTGDAGLLACGHWARGLALCVRGEDASGVEACRESVRASRDPLNRAVSLGWLGYVLIEHGEVRDGIIWLQSAVDQLRRYSYAPLCGWFLACLADGYLRTGEVSLAEEAVEEACGLVGKAQLPVGWVQRVRGRIALTRGDIEKAEACLREALLIFQNGGAEYEMGRVLAEMEKAQDCGSLLRSR